MLTTESLTVPAPPAATRSRFRLPAASLPVFAWVIAFAGLFAAAILSVGHLLDLPVPCGGSRGCNAVAAHPSSRIFGVPIAYLGVAVYLTVLFLLNLIPGVRRALLALLALTAVGTLTSGYLLYHSHTVIGAYCPWCIASGIAMTGLFILSVLMIQFRLTLTAPNGWWPLALALLTAAAVGVQAGRIHRSANEPPIPAERLAALSAADLVDEGKTLGPADAPTTVIVFADLWCPACRSAHHALSEYQKANPQVRLAFRHRPLSELRGHEMSGAAAALSELAAEKGKFWEFAGIMYKLPGRVDREGYRAIVKQLGVDPDEAEKRIASVEDPAVQRVYRDMTLADELEVNATPTFIVLMKGKPPVSANMRTLPRILNSPRNIKGS